MYRHLSILNTKVGPNEVWFKQGLTVFQSSSTPGCDKYLPYMCLRSQFRVFMFLTISV